MSDIYSTLIKELHKYAKNNQYQRAVVGLSGGLDSTVALCIAVRAFSGKNVTALILPEIGLTPNDDIEHAKALADHFGCQSHYQPINNFLVDYSFVTWDKAESANQNLKSRARSSLLRHYAEAHNALFIGMANKSDLLLGHGTLEGEFAGDLHIFGDCYKTDIIEMAKSLELPRDLLEKSHSRHLKPHQTDLEDLGAPWSKIDEILKELTEGADPEALIEKGLDSLVVHRASRFMQQSKGQTGHLKTIPLGRLTESIKKAQIAEASSLS
jgi:NAD+ synthetase